MDINLNLLAMNKGQLYEAIITTKNTSGVKNAAPFGVRCRNSKEIMLKIFKGSTSLENILKTKEFIVNITSNPLYFTKSTIGNIEEIYFEENYSLKDVDAYFKCKVIRTKEGTHKDDIDISDEVVIIAEVEDLVIHNKSAKALNRAIFALIESLVDYTRIDMVDENTKNEYLARFKKSKKLIYKVGSKEEKESINILESELIKKGFNL